MAIRRSAGLLAKKHYDNDATILPSDSDGDLDSHENNEVTDVGFRSKVQDEDREVLREEEERENLLARPTRFDAVKKAFTRKHDTGVGQRVMETSTESRRRRRKKRRYRGSRGSRDGELMFEMEEGFKDTSSQSSTESESFDIRRTKWAGREKKSRKCGRLALIHVVIILVFLSMVFGAYKASRKPNVRLGRPGSVSNGTHIFAPTTILISLDGFRADFLNRDITPALNAFIASGVSPKYMLPSFPSVTFPNHFTLVTGLYPESHGIVGNQFWDPELQEEFYYTDPSRSMQPKWWTAEPLWVTAEDQGVRTAIHMWPGSEAHIPDIEPTYLDKFNEDETLINKVDRILGWLDLPGDEDDAKSGEKRPQLIAAYVPNVDADGHKYGPNSTEIRQTISDVDSMLTLLVEGLYSRNLTEIINLVVVSDHGMATTSTSRLIQLDDLIDLSLIDHIDGWPLQGLRLKNPDRDLSIVYDQLLKANSPGFDVYTLDTMPEQYHFKNNDRIAPLWIVPKVGWAVVERKDFDISEALTIGKKFRPMGLHGYDHEHPLMRAIFVARGPAFPHQPNSEVPVFQNIEVYNIVCDSLGIKPHPNNGTLRLPLRTEGLHGPKLEDPADLDDPVETDDADREFGETEPNTPDEPDEPKLPDQPEEPKIPEYPDEPDTPEKPDEPDGDNEENPPKKASGWWDFIHDQVEKAEEWAKGVIESLKGDGKEKSGG